MRVLQEGKREFLWAFGMDLVKDLLWNQAMQMPKIFYPSQKSLLPFVSGKHVERCIG